MTTLRVRLGILLALVALVLVTVPRLAPPVAAADVNAKPTLLGIAIDNTWRAGLDTFTAATGRPPAIFQVFWPVDTLDWTDSAPFGTQDWTTDMLTALQARGMIAYVEVEVNDIDALNAGTHDVHLAAMAETIASWLAGDPARRILIAPLPESNNQDHPWGGDPVAFKSAYARIRNAFLSQGPGPDQMRFIFGMNGLANVAYPHEENGYVDFYPGDGAVDIIGFAKLNRDDPNWRSYDEMFTMHVEELHRTISFAKPILVIQTGSIPSGAGGETRDDWLADMFSGLRAEPQVIGAIYFDRNKYELGAWHDYRIIKDGALDPAIPALYASWSDPSQYEWIFDGSMDAWVANREATIPPPIDPPAPVDPPPSEPGLPFVDISGSIFVDDIVWLADTGITRGCGDGTTFCPGSRVTRGQMASFLVRALDLPPSAEDFFGDDDGSVHEGDINALAAAGITRGCSPDPIYCGGSSVTREQMAAFLRRAFA